MSQITLHPPVCQLDPAWGGPASGPNQIPGYRIDLSQFASVSSVAIEYSQAGKLDFTQTNAQATFTAFSTATNAYGDTGPSNTFFLRNATFGNVITGIAESPDLLPGLTYFQVSSLYLSAYNPFILINRNVADFIPPNIEDQYGGNNDYYIRFNVITGYPVSGFEEGGNPDWHMIPGLVEEFAFTVFLPSVVLQHKEITTDPTSWTLSTSTMRVSGYAAAGTVDSYDWVNDLGVRSKDGIVASERDELYAFTPDVSTTYTYGVSSIHNTKLAIVTTPNIDLPNSIAFTLSGTPVMPTSVTLYGTLSSRFEDSTDTFILNDDKGNRTKDLYNLSTNAYGTGNFSVADAAFSLTSAISGVIEWPTGRVILDWANNDYLISQNTNISATYTYFNPSMQVSASDRITTNAVTFNTLYSSTNAGEVDFNMKSPPYFYYIDVLQNPLTGHNINYYFELSAGLSGNSATNPSTLSVSSIMVDKLHNGTYSFSVSDSNFVQFRYSTNSANLQITSIKTDEVFNQTTSWLPGSADHVTIGPTVGTKLANKLITVEVSSSPTSITTEVDPFYYSNNFTYSFNSGLEAIGFRVLQESDTFVELSARVIGGNTPIEPSGSIVRWNISPSTPHIAISGQTPGWVTETDGFITLNTLVSAYSATRVLISGLGLQDTNIEMFSDTYQTTASYTWSPNFAATSLVFEKIKLNNQPYVRSLSTRLCATKSDSDVNYVLPSNWRIKFDKFPNTTWISTMSAVGIDGARYQFGQTTKNLATNLSATDFLISTDYFTESPKTSAFAVSAVVTSQTSLVGEVCGVVDQFPDPTLFDTSFTIRTVPTHVAIASSSNTSTVVRSIDDGYAKLRVEDTTLVESVPAGAGTSVSALTWLTGGSIWKTGFTLTGPICSTVTTTTAITLSAHSVSAAGWLSAHSMDVQIDFNLLAAADILNVDLSATPSIVFDPARLDVRAPSTVSRGVSAYDRGHTETFIISSANSADSFLWEISAPNGQRAFAGNPISATFIGSPDMVTSNGSAIAVSAFNQYYPSSMPIKYVADDETVAFYPNATATVFSNNSDPLFQNIRFVDYEAGIMNVSSAELQIDADLSEEVSANARITFGSFSPVEVHAGTVTWRLSSSYGWSINTQTPYIGTDEQVLPISFGDPASALFVTQGDDSTLRLDASANITKRINEAPNDWALVSEDVNATFVDGKEIYYSVFSAPDIKIYSLYHYASTDVATWFEDVSLTNTNSVCAFVSAYWDFGDNTGTPSLTTTPGTIATHTYTSAGTYSVSVTGQITSDSIRTKTFTNAVVVVSAFNPFDSTITRNLTDPLILPHDKADVELGSNEWVTEETFNASLQKLDNNLTYIRNVSKTHTFNIPTVFVGWLGNYQDNDLFSSATVNDLKWHNNINGIDTYRTGYASSSSISFSGMNDVFLSNERFYFLEDTKMTVMSATRTPTTIASLTSITIDEPFVKAKAIAIDSSNNVFVLEQDQNAILKFKTDFSKSAPLDIIAYSTRWGGLGGAIANHKFNGATDISIDDKDDVYVADANNLVVKKYSNTGTWITTISHDLFTQTSKPISVSVDADLNIFVLTQTHIVKFDNEYNETGVYALEKLNGNTPVKIYASVETGFLYIVTNKSVIKATNAGLFIGEFLGLSANGIDGFTGINQDNLRHIYVSDFDKVFKFVDLAEKFEISSDTSSNVWSIDDTKIAPQEFVADWQYNRSLKRMADNVTLQAKALHSKFLVINNSDGDISSWRTRPLVDAEFVQACQFDQNFVGVNEVVSTGVVNRGLGQLWNCQQKLLDSLADAITTTCEGGWCWSWEKLKCSGFTFPSPVSCDGNPITYKEMECTSPRAGSKKWIDAKSDCCELCAFNAFAT